MIFYGWRQKRCYCGCCFSLVVKYKNEYIKCCGFCNGRFVDYVFHFNFIIELNNNFLDSISSSFSIYPDYLIAFNKVRTQKYKEKSIGSRTSTQIDANIVDQSIQSTLIASLLKEPYDETISSRHNKIDVHTNAPFNASFYVSPSNYCISQRRNGIRSSDGNDQIIYSNTQMIYRLVIFTLHCA